MRKLKVLNLYAGIGGNRKLWENVDVTAVEIVPEIAEIYKNLYPGDEVVIGDAHQYLLNHYQEFDFIWSSPPCQSHSKLRGITCVAKGQNEPIYFDSALWQEIVFLQTYCKCDWVVENVIPYYKPLVPPAFKIQRHLFWSNRFILSTNFKADNIDRGSIKEWERNLGISLDGYNLKGIRKDQVLKNCVKPELGFYVFNQIIQQKIEREAA